MNRNTYGKAPDGAEILDLERLKPGCLTIAKQTGFVILITEILRSQRYSTGDLEWVEVSCMTLDNRKIDSCTFWRTTGVWVVYPVE